MSAVILTAELQAYSYFFLTFACVVFMAALWLFAFKRDHPMMVIRYPRVMAIDLLVNSTNGIVLVLMNLDYFGARFPCVPWQSFIDGLDCCANALLIGRAVMFFAQAYSEMKQQEVLLTSPNLMRTLDIVALLTAPGDYFRFRKRMKATNGTPTVIVDNPSAASLLYGLRFIAVGAVWFSIGFAYSFWPTYSNLGITSIVVDELQVYTPTVCWMRFVVRYSSVLYLISAVVCAVILFAVYPLNDSVGLKHDLAFSMSVGMVFKLVNGILMLFPDDVLPMLYMYPIASTLPTAMSIGIAIYYIKSYDKNASRTMITVELDNAEAGEDASMTSLEALRSMKRFDEFEKFRRTPQGRAFVEQVSRKYYAYESVKFLDACENLPQKQDAEYATSLHWLFQNFIKIGSEWEINISHDMRDRLTRLILEAKHHEDEEDDEVQKCLNAVRVEVTKMLLPLVQKEMREQPVAAVALFQPSSTQAT
eukprot:TRINITY_DN1571_c0_g1_i1.p1 TRINITY_DN1571_c0_g1~~TRINITY_DN1571_c0_g1_i1.p1  ORF type:complete len:494 (+),score=93.58 TRINITY_DN1571_c0_g1_i1:52-1482(+)